MARENVTTLSEECERMVTARVVLELTVPLKADETLEQWCAATLARDNKWVAKPASVTPLRVFERTVSTLESVVEREL